MTDMTDASSERMMTPELMITGEAVALEIIPASVGLRLLSGLIDYGLYAAGAVLTLTTWSAAQAYPCSYPIPHTTIHYSTFATKSQ